MPVPARQVWDPARTRRLVLGALPGDTSLQGEPPDPRAVYLPASHAKALRLDALLVSGMRGAGKSFWWSALQRPEVRGVVASLDRDAGMKNWDVRVGFGEPPNPSAYPDRDTIAKILHGRMDARDIWRAVILRHEVKSDHPVATGSWEDAVRWVRQNPEQVGSVLADFDLACDREGKSFLILFDALDRSARNWKDMHRLIRGLLEVALDLRPYRRTRVKCFLRSDQVDEARIGDFPDASKILPQRVELRWFPQDLYGLLWHHLANLDAPDAEWFREAVSGGLGVRWSDVAVGEALSWWVRPETMDEERQRRLFHAVAGPWMGKDRRRGFPYTWIPGHLADAAGNVSPRSFLAAIRTAAADTGEKYPRHEWALHYESIKRGVQVASDIRVAELREDYPWVNALMQPLKGLVVPAPFESVVQLWDKGGVIGQLQGRVQGGEERLPPAHLDGPPEGLRVDLEQLGILVRLTDGRVNVPDVFRVGYGLGRRGGVKPLRTD